MFYSVKTVAPSNSTFGYFFSFLFFMAAIFWSNSFDFNFFLMISAMLLGIAFKRPNIFEVPNMLWFKFGLVLGHVLNPLLLGLMYFLIFTPLGLLLSLFARDELKMSHRDTSTYWIVRSESDVTPSSFTSQFWVCMSFLLELISFLKFRKKLWLLPLLLFLVIMGMSLILVNGSIVAPFMYTIF